MSGAAIACAATNAKIIRPYLIYVCRALSRTSGQSTKFPSLCQGKNEALGSAARRAPRATHFELDIARGMLYTRGMKPHLPLSLRAALLAALPAFWCIVPTAFAEEEQPARIPALASDTRTTRITSSADISSSVQIVSKLQDGTEAHGAAIDLESETDKLTINGAQSVTLTSNAVGSPQSTPQYKVNAFGGAVYSVGSINIWGGGAVSFSDNRAYHVVSPRQDTGGSWTTAQCWGGAVYNAAEMRIVKNTDISFTGNQAAVLCNTSLKNYGLSSFDAMGGAVYNTGTMVLDGKHSTERP